MSSLMAGYSFKAWWMATSVPMTIAYRDGIMVSGLVVIALLTVAVSVRLKTLRNGNHGRVSPTRRHP